jgi:glycosyltransferase involved in cell wall biosynthesis/ubiquinone/menaquinone biosynthesis C-methylase UbiE
MQTERTEGIAWLYVTPSLTEAGVLHCEALDTLTERDRIMLDPPPLGLHGPLLSSLRRVRVVGLVFEMARGWPGRHQLVAASRLLRNYRVIFYWPQESAAEAIDGQRLVSYWALWARAKAYTRHHPPPAAAGGDLSLVSATQEQVALEVEGRAEELLNDPRPDYLVKRDKDSIPGWGIYLRTDYWAPIQTGGSYGHTCYVAKELSSRCDQLVCVMANRFPLLDTLGIRQVVLQAHSTEANEGALLAASPTWTLQLRPLLESVRPAFIYERLCLGNLSGAQLSRELRIPYLVEYNGSELSIKKSFDGGVYSRGALFEQIEEAAFAQASVVSVVSAPIRDSLVERGVDPAKILVNPNGADPDAYRPATKHESESVRNELGFRPTDCVIGFTGTFGGWHGIEVLAEAIPEVLERAPRAAFLLVGDGQLRALVSDVVEKHSLSDRVVMTGRVPHEEGARLLGGCDVFVSPHASHMVDSPFFGSPTKLFEYMAMGRAIVASNLQQIGEVLQPALKPSEILQRDLVIGDQRAVLCEPGDTVQLVEALCGLVERPEVAGPLGVNARKVLVENYTWAKHVERLMDFAVAARQLRPATQTRQAKKSPAPPDEEQPPPDSSPTLVTSYKTEVRRQWDADPCGSHYVEEAEKHTLEWFAEAERYRYEEYARWMPGVMEFADWGGKRVLEVGGGMGTDLVQFARNGALTTDCDMSTEHLRLAQENFALRDLRGDFVNGDAERLPFASGSFDLVYSNGVLHHTPGTKQAVEEMYRVLRPGGRAIVMVYAEFSWHYWKMLVGEAGLRRRQLEELSIGEIMSRSVELSTTDARPLVKVYSSIALRRMFASFDRVKIGKYQFTPAERHNLPKLLKRVPAAWLGRVVGWNLVVKADKGPR